MFIYRERDCLYFHLLKDTFFTLSWLSRSLLIHGGLLEFLPNFLLDEGQGPPSVSAYI